VKEPTSDLSYRASAVREATPAGLVVILYDILVGDLRRAINSMRSGDVERRCDRLKHGLSALQLLEGSLDYEKGGDTARSLSRFYSHIRSQVLQAQFENDPRILEQQIDLIFSVREAWQEVNSVSESEPRDGRSLPVGMRAATEVVSDDVRSNWSA
jgi:flagellar secretion chaperone FliS